jgi:PASTA domain
VGQPASRAAKTFAPRSVVTTPNGAEITSQFEGTSEASTAEASGLPGIPDAESATNGSQVVEVLFGSSQQTGSGGFIQIFDNNGISQCLNGSGLPLATFLQTTDSLGDPRVQYDNVQGHFIMSVPVESFTGSDIPAHYVAISNTSDPCGLWQWYRLTFSGGQYVPGNRLDHVMLGQDRNAALFQANIYSSSQQFRGFSIFAIKKADLYAGNAVSFPTFTVGSQAAPAINAGEPMISSSSAWFLGADPNTGYQLYRMGGTGTSNPTVTLQATISSPYNQGGVAFEPDGFYIDFIDGFLDTTPVFDGTRVWFTHGVKQQQPNDGSAVRYGYVDVTTNQVTDSLMSVDPGNCYELNGSVEVGLNANGTKSIFLNWAYTDPSKNLTVSDAVAAFVFNGSLPSPIGSMQTLITGNDGDNSLFSNNSSVAVENRQIGNSTCAITTQQYFNDSWVTRLARICSPDQINVPSVAGLTPAQAGTALAGFGLAAGGQITTTTCNGIIPGRVVSTTPASNTAVPFGTAINLLVCANPRTIPVPDVTGETPAQAAADIQAAGLTVGSAGVATSCDVPIGTIIRTIPPAGSLVAFGATVGLIKSRALSPDCA